MKINVNLKSMGKRRGAVKPVTYEIPGYPGTVRELIYAVTRAGVEEYNQRMESPDLLRYLTSGEIDDKAQAGKISFGVNYGEKKADIAKAQENAVQCFEDGIYRIFLDEEPVEAPTLEWVEFSNRKTFEPFTIELVPDLIYSEVMRDVDLAVSVAHAGGVDPETSHSTIEMRRAIVEFNLPLFKIKNVTLKESHALIQGTRGNYSVHLGSGVIHQEGGAMLNILPVHSQKRENCFYLLWMKTRRQRRSCLKLYCWQKITR